MVPIVLSPPISYRRSKSESSEPVIPMALPTSDMFPLPPSPCPQGACRNCWNPPTSPRKCPTAVLVESSNETSVTSLISDPTYQRYETSMHRTITEATPKIPIHDLA